MSFALTERPKNVRVTKALATEFRDMTPAPADRELSQQRIEAYRKAIEIGIFRPTVDWCSAYCEETKSQYRVNGKHTSTLLSSLDSIPSEMTACISEYRCETMDDVAKLYATFDTNEQMRRAGDIYRIFAAIDPTTSSLSSRVVSLCVSGVAFRSYESRYTNSTTAAGRAEYLLDGTVRQFASWLSDIVGKKGSRHVHRVPAVAAMFATWSKCRKDATEFWTAIIEETGLSPTLPDRKLAKYLITHTVNSGRGASRNAVSTRAAPREVYVKCLIAWNAYRAGATTDLKFYPHAKTPAVK
jgi:hypothetical protein